MNYPKSTFDNATELSVLAYFLLDDDSCFYDITEKDFCNVVHRRIFKEIYAGHKPNYDKLLELGLSLNSRDFIYECLNTNISMVQNCKNLKQMTLGRKSYYDSQINIKNLNKATLSELPKLVGNAQVAQTIYKPSEARKRLEMESLPKTIKFEPESINESFKFFSTGWVAMIAASTGVGKTSTAIQISRSISEHEGSVCLYVSLEMPFLSYLERAMTIAFYKNNPWAGYKDWLYFRKTMTVDTLSQYAVYDQEIILDKAGITVKGINEEIKKLKAEGINLKTVVIDHLYILRAETNVKTENQEMQSIVSSIDQMAKEQDVRVLVLGQTRKGDKDDRYSEPYLSDVRGSKAVTEIMWWCMLLWRDENDKSILNWKNAKNRYGDGVGDKGQIKVAGTYMYDDISHYNNPNTREN